MQRKSENVEIGNTESQRDLEIERKRDRKRVMTREFMAAHSRKRQSAKEIEKEQIYVLPMIVSY